MDMVFLKILNMSIAASWVVLAVLVLRFALKKAPKWISVALWALVAVRLVCPFSFESVLSLIPSTETVPEEIFYMEGEELHRNAYLDVVENSTVYESVTVELDRSIDSVTLREMFAAFIWMGGMGVMAMYALISYLGLKKKVSASIYLTENIFLCDYIDTPFILGMIKPKIYLPSSMDPDSAAHVLAHERAHLKRKDHWWKPLGFALLTVHWFNPILWLAYVLLCRDIEMACDERVVREMGVADKKAYSEALLRCSVSRKMIAACPLAFGEVGVKDRVKSVLNYKKPGFWIILVAVIALVIAAVCLLTDPVTGQNDQKNYPMSGPNLSDIDTQQVLKQIRKYNGMENTQNAYMNSRGFTLLLDENFDFASASVQYFFYEEQQIYTSVLIFAPLGDSFILLGTEEWEEQESLFLLDHYLEALRCLPQAQVRSLTPNAERYTIRHVEEGTPASYDRVIRYASGGIGSTDGWYIHLEVTPMYRNPENGDWMEMKEEAVHLFYGDGGPDVNGVVMDAKVLEIHDKSFLVEPVSGSWELNSASQIYVPMQNMDASPEPQIGDILRITYDGNLMESYPAQIGEVFRIRVVSDEYNINMETTSLDYHVDENGVLSNSEYPDDYVTYSEHYINMALPRLDGWEYEITKYEEATYRCGIRFRPKGERGWLNLQWGHFSVPKEGRTVVTRSLGNCTVEVGSYLGEPYWRYMHFPDAPDYYTLWNADADGWLGNPAYQEALQLIMDNIRVAEGVLWKDQLLEKIQFVLFLYEYEQLTANMSQITGIWSVDLWREDGTGTTLTFDQEGRFLSREAFESEAATEGGVLEENTKGTVYQYEKEGFGSPFTITLYDDGTFAYYEGTLSSYMGMGTWKQEGDVVTLYDEQHFKNHFRFEGDDLLFAAEGSTNFMYVDVAEGDRFVRQSG